MTAKEYVKVHDWIRSIYGPADRCESSQCEPMAWPRYSWANISEMYLYDVDDWMMLCRKCHVKFDKERTNLRKKATIEERYGLTESEFHTLPRAERAALKQKWMEKQPHSQVHPLEWTDREMKYLIEQDFDIRSLYLAMGNTLLSDQPVPEKFIQRCERLASDDWKNRLEAMKPLAFKQRVDALRGKG